MSCVCWLCLWQCVHSCVMCACLIALLSFASALSSGAEHSHHPLWGTAKSDSTPRPQGSPSSESPTFALSCPQRRKTYRFCFCDSCVTGLVVNMVCWALHGIDLCFWVHCWRHKVWQLLCTHVYHIIMFLRVGGDREAYSIRNQGLNPRNF